MQIKAILFDIDGTLVDSNEMHVLAWGQAFAGFGRTIEQSVIHDQIGKGADMLIPALLPDVDQSTQSELSTQHDRIFRDKFRDEVRPFPRARDLLVHVAGLGQKVVLASSASEDDLDHYLDLFNVRHLVTATTTSADVKRTKPAPDIFSTALDKLPGIAASEVVVVGDTPYDIKAATKCGIATIALRCGGFSDEALEHAGPIAIYDDVAALLADYERSPLAK